MSKVIYSLGMSLDGYIEDADGDFDWSAPDAAIHQLANDQAREARVFVYGRRLYEIMEPYWPDAAEDDTLPPVEAEFARLYSATPRIIVSDTLETVGANCTLIRRADARAAVQRLRAEPDEGHIDLGGSTLAASLIDLVDEFRVWVSPVAVGGGKPFFPTGVHLPLELLECRPFDSGVVWMRYARVREQ